MEQWIAGVMADFGHAGVFWLMVAENLIPPLPSEVIMPLAGFAAAKGQLDFVTVVLLAIAGTTLGNLPWYFAARRLGAERLAEVTARHGRYLLLRPANVTNAVAWFERYGILFVCLGRLVPGLRAFVSVPAGLAGMGVVPFVLWSGLGSAIWVTGLAWLGFVLREHWNVIERNLAPVGGIFFATLALFFLVWAGLRRSRAS